MEFHETLAQFGGVDRFLSATLWMIFFTVSKHSHKKTYHGISTGIYFHLLMGFLKRIDLIVNLSIYADMATNKNEWLLERHPY